MKHFHVSKGLCFNQGLADRRCSRRGEAVGAIHPLQPLGVDARPASPERGQLPLTAWLQELGVDVDLSDLLVQGRGASPGIGLEPIERSQIMAIWLVKPIQIKVFMAVLGPMTAVRHLEIGG